MLRQDQNSKSETRNFFVHCSFALLILLPLLSGCAGDAQSRQQLDDGKHAISAGQYQQAIRDADNVIQRGDSDGLAEAYFLRGYAIEAREKPDNIAKSRDLAMARDSYTTGLSYNPRPVIAARLHVQLGNVCYHQEDFPTALREFGLAMPVLDQTQFRPQILYEMGICEQCLGRFEDADSTFQRVQQAYPMSEYAGYSRTRSGIRGFYVQVGMYSQSADITRAATAVAASGSVALQTTQHQSGLTVVRTADVPSFGQAQRLKSLLAPEYPDARVMP
jgi:tetratricopeptide (TPR) repeat protein